MLDQKTCVGQLVFRFLLALPITQPTKKPTGKRLKGLPTHTTTSQQLENQKAHSTKSRHHVELRQPHQQLQAHGPRGAEEAAQLP